MPTYEYQCEACGHAFEQFQSITAAPIRKCPSCGKNKVKRLLGTGAGLIFKGKGFYITDYRSESYEKAAKADSGGGNTDAARPDAAKTDAKPDAGTAGKAQATPPAEAKPRSAEKPAAPASKSPKKGK